MNSVTIPAEASYTPSDTLLKANFAATREYFTYTIMWKG